MNKSILRHPLTLTTVTNYVQRIRRCCGLGHENPTRIYCDRCEDMLIERERLIGVRR